MYCPSSNYRQSKIGVVKEIEKLESDRQDTAFPVRDLRIFHDREVRVNVARSSITVAALRKRHARTAQTFRERTQCSGVKSRFAARLHK
jgi:hypothetical protein